MARTSLSCSPETQHIGNWGKPSPWLGEGKEKKTTRFRDIGQDLSNEAETVKTQRKLQNHGLLECSHWGYFPRGEGSQSAQTFSCTPATRNAAGWKFGGISDRDNFQVLNTVCLFTLQF